MMRFAKRGPCRCLMAWLACLHLFGGPVALLQVVGWGGMLVSYTAEDGLAKGVADTFSGERPCPLCEAVKELEDDRSDPALPGGEVGRRLAEMMGQAWRAEPVATAPGVRSLSDEPSTARAADQRAPEDWISTAPAPPPRVA